MLIMRVDENTTDFGNCSALFHDKRNGSLIRLEANVSDVLSPHSC
jgi:hypothetical protein